MLRQLSYYVYSNFILLIFIYPSVYGITCTYSQIHCYSSLSYDWCCPNYKVCGSTYQSCYTRTSPTPTDIPPVFISLMIIIPLCICITCIRLCVRSQQEQRIRPAVYNTNPRVVPYPYQQRSMPGPPQVVQNRAVYNVNAAPQIHNIYEAPPPSYDAAISNLSPKYSSAPSTAPISTIEETNSRI